MDALRRTCPSSILYHKPVTRKPRKVPSELKPFAAKRHHSFSFQRAHNRKSWKRRHETTKALRKTLKRNCRSIGSEEKRKVRSKTKKKERAQTLGANVQDQSKVQLMGVEPAEAPSHPNTSTDSKAKGEPRVQEFREGSNTSTAALNNSNW